MINDCGISDTDAGDYKPYEDMLEMGCYIVSPNNYPEPFNGRVWPGNTTWPDWFHPNATDYWVEQLNTFHKQLDFDGLWNDMNEISNFCEAECGYSPVLNTTSFTPGGNNLNEKTVDLATMHYNVSDPNNLNSAILDYNAHSLFGFMEGEATYEYFRRQKKRPFIISRSTFVTSGRTHQHWLGDNHAEWEYLRLSIAGVLDY